MNDLPEHSFSENYHGFIINGFREYPTMGDYERWRFTVLRGDNIEFRHSIKDSGSQLDYLGEETDANQFLLQTGITRVHGMIDLAMYEAGESTEYVIGEDVQVAAGLTDESVQQHILQVLQRIRKRVPDRYRFETIDVIGFCKLLDIERSQFEYNASYLRDKQYVADVHTQQKTLELGGIFITADGIDYLKDATSKNKTHRIFIDDISSFEKVRWVGAQTVDQYLNEGRFEKLEDEIQVAFEQILSVPLHKKDWGGETNDLYTANVKINGRNIATAFLLKGNGLKKKTMEISDCGKNGDQLLRLFRSPAKLFVVQFVGNISENVIDDVEGKVRERRLRGDSVYYCTIDGQDTARLLYAYGYL